MIRRNTVRSRSKIIRMKKVPGPQLYSPREKLQDCIWIFTIGDADDKPLVPHAHAQGTGYRLDAWTGDIYPAGSERKRTIGKLSKKELARLHSDPGFLKFARKQIQWYRENNPKINFYVPEWFTTLTRRSKLAAIKQEGVAGVFSVGLAVASLVAGASTSIAPSLMMVSTVASLTGVDCSSAEA